MKQPTIRDVATKAGVSPASVSRYLTKSAHLPQEMALRIGVAVASLGYRPNVLARRLSRGSSEVIGFVTSDIAAPFFSAIASAAEEEAEKFGFSVMICNTRNKAERELLYISKLADAHFDGLIFLTNHVDDGSLRDAINGSGSNVVLVDEDVPGTSVPKFVVDNFGGGYQATRHMIRHGHRRIAHITGPVGLTSVDYRLEGYRQALRDAGVPLDDRLVKPGTYFDVGQHVARAFRELRDLPDPPTAIVATSDALALAVYQVARECSLNVPEDISITGFDDLPYASFLDPPLTTVRQPTVELGQHAVRALLDKGRAAEPVSPLPVQFIERGSVGPVAAGTSMKRRRASARARSVT